MDIQKLRAGLKLLLKKNNLDYADLAKIWKISESSVKRIMASGEISLERISHLSSSLGIEISQLFSIIENSPNFDVLTDEQDHMIASHPVLMYLNVRLRGGDSLEDFSQDTGISINDVYRLALKLEKVNLIKLNGRTVIFVKKGPYRVKDKGEIERRLFPRFVETIYKHNSQPDRIRTPFNSKTDQLTRAFELFMSQKTMSEMIYDMSQIYFKFAEKSRNEVATTDFKKLKCVSSLIMCSEQHAWKEALSSEFNKYEKRK